MGETISKQTNVNQGSVLVELFEHEGFYWLTEEIISKFQLTDVFVVLECIYQEEKSGVVQFAGREVKTLQLGGTSANFTRDDQGKDLKDFIAKEVFIANKCLNVGSWQYVTQVAESIWSNFVQRHIQFFEIVCLR